MTDQPTTWTPERALEWLKDVSDHNLSSDKIKAKWGSDAFPSLFSVVIPALESAADEIERQKARADAAERYSQGLVKDIERLRAELAAERDRAHRAEQAHAVAESKVDEMLHPAAQQGPSDEEIDSAIDSVRRHRLNSEDAFIETYHALRKIARRAGVKL